MFELNVAQRQAYNPWPHSPTAKAKSLIGTDKRVLDIGCASGYMARELKNQRCRTWGIELDPEVARQARDCCEEVIEANVELLEELPYPYEFFDVILCLDVFEHLNRPDLVLCRLRPYLASDGMLIASIPNIARVECRLKLLMGKFDYADGGIMSKGHLRFFTRQSARQLLQSSGFRIERVEPTGLGSILSLSIFTLKLHVWPTLTAFQFLFVARPV